MTQVTPHPLWYTNHVMWPSLTVWPAFDALEKFREDQTAQGADPGVVKRGGNFCDNFRPNVTLKEKKPLVITFVEKRHDALTIEVWAIFRQTRIISSMEVLPFPLYISLLW